MFYFEIRIKLKLFLISTISIIKNIKRWNDGAFLDLNSETVEAECEDFYKEILKIQKQFSNILKRRKIELNTIISEKKKAKSKYNILLLKYIEIFYKLFINNFKQYIFNFFIISTIINKKKRTSNDA